MRTFAVVLSPMKNLATLLVDLEGSSSLLILPLNELLQQTCAREVILRD